MLILWHELWSMEVIEVMIERTQKKILQGALESFWEKTRRDARPPSEDHRHVCIRDARDSSTISYYNMFHTFDCHSLWNRSDDRSYQAWRRCHTLHIWIFPLRLSPIPL